jgi:ankyrin repeat protein
MVEFLDALLRSDAPAIAKLLDSDSELLHVELEGEQVPEYMGRGRAGNRALHLAAYLGDADVLDLLLERGADPEARNREGRTALHVGLEHNNLAAKHLMMRGVPRDIVACACAGDLDGMRTLLSSDPELANDKSTQLSVLGWACYHGAKESVQLLIDSGARIDDCELCCCAGVANVELAGLLVDAGADVNEASDDHGATALHVAAAHMYTSDSTEFVRFLLEAGADKTAVAGPKEMTALQLAELRRDGQAQRGVGPSDEGFKNFEAVIQLLRD